MKKMNVSLKDLNVRSFITSLADGEKGEVKGGATLYCPWTEDPLHCPDTYCDCDTDLHCA